MWQLTFSQQSAVDAFRDFMSGTEQVFLLKGAAGTGKTTVVSEFMKILKKANRVVALMAPTGRAAHILRQKTGAEAKTIHSAIYAFDASSSAVVEGKDDVEIQARFKLKENDDPASALYVVDESSMVSDTFSESESVSFGSGRLLADLFEFARGRKIVFVGDYAQLPPVGMNFSPALDKEYVERTFGCKVSETVLRDVMRQQSAGVMLCNANKIRDCIEAKTFVEFGLQDGKDTESENVDLLKPYFEQSDCRPDMHSVVIAYSNSQALQYNLSVRRHYFGENAPRLKQGDLLVVARNNYAFGHELFNGSVVLVASCTCDANVEQHTVRVKMSKDRIETVVLRFRKAVVKFNAGGVAATENVTILDNFLDDPSGSVGTLLSWALKIDFEKRLSEDVRGKLSEIKKLLRGGQKLSVGQQEFCEAYAKLLRDDPYYNAVVCKYGYAMTCHKAQGGEWENVFVDMCRFGGTANEDYFRWAYTAITRASKKVWHYRSPDFNYISKLVVEPIQKSENLRVSTYSDGTDFCQSRFGRIKSIAEKCGMSVSEDKSAAYQHRIAFCGNDGGMAIFVLWYNKKGYSNKEVLLSSSSDELTEFSKEILKASYEPENVPFSDPQRPFAEKLVDFFKTQFQEIGIKLLDITNEQYQDVFHLRTDGYAKVCMNYTGKGNYTHMKLMSTLGEADGKLQSFRQRFI